MILSSCQRLGVVPSPEWQAILAAAFLSTIDTKEKAVQVRTDFFVKPLVGLAGMGWKPDQGEWQVGECRREVWMYLDAMFGNNLPCQHAMRECHTHAARLRRDQQCCQVDVCGYG